MANFDEGWPIDKRLIDFNLVTMNRARAVRCFLSFVTQNRKVSSNFQSTFQLKKHFETYSAMVYFLFQKPCAGNAQKGRTFHFFLKTFRFKCKENIDA